MFGKEIGIVPQKDLRWLASEKARVNLSIDIAQGRDGTAAHVYVKEAF